MLLIVEPTITYADVCDRGAHTMKCTLRSARRERHHAVDLHRALFVLRSCVGPLTSKLKVFDSALQKVGTSACGTKFYALQGSSQCALQLPCSAYNLEAL